jgi:hypothetical protein
LPCIWPIRFPDTVVDWFQLLQDNPVAGLVNLDLLLVVDNVLLVVIALALYVALLPTSPSVTTVATGAAGRVHGIDPGRAGRRTDGPPRHPPRPPCRWSLAVPDL